jgi:hypothetical protein
MNFEQFQLPLNLVQALYTDVLPAGLTAAAQATGRNTPDQTLFLGENLKHILILVKNPVARLLGDAELEFLSGILKACKIGFQDVAVLNLAQMPNTDYTKLSDQFKPAIVMLFGAGPADISLPVIFPEFQIQSYRDIRFLSAPPLENIGADKLLKSKLWLCLRQIFSI